MPYFCNLYDCIEQMDLAAWESICGRGEHDFTMDTRYLRCVQESIASQARFWYIIIRDSSSHPVACACLCEFTVDLLIIAGERLKRALSYFRRIFPHSMSFTVLMCGLPVSIGQSSVRFARGADHSAAVEQLESLMQELAGKASIRFVLFKEFDAEGCRQLAGLLKRGYVQAESLPMNYFAPTFKDFEHYLSSLKAHYRQDIRRSMNKLQRGGFTISRVPGRKALELYTDEVHKLYRAVVDRAANKLEILPREFFLALAGEFPESISFTYISRGGVIAAFNWAMQTPQKYQLLFCGLNYELNTHAELYFNLMYAELDNALRASVATVEIGQTADLFKARLGCFQRPLWFYAKTTRVARVFRLCSRFLFPRRGNVTLPNIYKYGSKPVVEPCISSAFFPAGLRRPPGPRRCLGDGIWPRQ